jgi:hypothetical protein
MSKHKTSKEILADNIKEVNKYNEKYVYGPLRFIGWILFFIILYTFIFLI